MVDKDEFLKLSREIQYSELQIESEDSLFDIISQIIEMHKDTDKISDILFLEEIEFVCLSETKFLEFVSSFDFNIMSGQLWKNLCKCFFPHPVKKCQRKMKVLLSTLNQNKRDIESIIVCGFNKHNRLGVKSNNKKSDYPIISTPVKLSFDSTSLLSYSAFLFHSVLVMIDGSLNEIGDNSNGQISATLQKS